MADEKKFEALEGRIVELENQLKQRGVKHEAQEFTPEELETYAKVRDVIAADYGEFCGINDCFRCVQRCLQVCVVRCIQVCINECTCGPCNWGHLGGGGGGRFGGLGY